MDAIDAGTPATPPSAPGAPALALAPAPADPVRWGPDELNANRGWSILTAVSLLAVFCLLRFLPQVGWPLVLAGIGAYLFDPTVVVLNRRGLSRTAATTLLFASGAILTGGVLLVFAPMLFAQAAKLPAYLETTLQALVPRIEQLTGAPLPSDVKTFAALAEQHLEQILTQVLPTAGSVVGTLVGGSLSVLSFVLGALVVPVVGFYLLKGWPNVVRGADELVPSRQRPFVRLRMAEIDRMLAGFIRGQLTMAAVLSGLYSLVLTVIGLKLAVVVGLVTGFGNLVPYVGTATGLLLATGFCLVDFGVDYHLVLVVGTFVLLVALDGVFITPRIVGNKVGLSPAAVIVAVLACGSLFGFAGVLLAVPSAAILKVVLRVARDVYRQTRTYREG